MTKQLQTGHKPKQEGVPEKGLKELEKLEDRDIQSGSDHGADAVGIRSGAFLKIRRQKRNARTETDKVAKNGKNGKDDAALPCPDPMQTAVSDSVGEIDRGKVQHRCAKQTQQSETETKRQGKLKKQKSLQNSSGVSLIQRRRRKKEEKGEEEEKEEREEKVGKAGNIRTMQNTLPRSSPDKDEADRKAARGKSIDSGEKSRFLQETDEERNASETPFGKSDEDGEHSEFEISAGKSQASAAANTLSSSVSENEDFRFGDDRLTLSEIGRVLRYPCTQTRDELGERIWIRESSNRDYYIGRDAADAENDEALRDVAAKYGASWGCVVWNKARIGCEYAGYAAAEWISLGALFENYAESLRSYLSTEEIVDSIRTLCTRYFLAVHGPLEISGMKRLQLFVFEIAEAALAVPAFRSTMCLNAMSINHRDVVYAVLEMILPKNLREALAEYEPFKASAYWQEGMEPDQSVIDELRTFWKSIVMPQPTQSSSNQAGGFGNRERR